jgi:AcrR family transcriptional regulator
MTKRDPDRTRQILLDAAFLEIHRNGFNAARLDHIAEGTGVTKGAIYHHFPNKSALGHAVLDEVVKPFVLNRWLHPIGESSDPIAAIKEMVRKGLSELPEEMCCLGCPLNNLAQELSSVDEEFRVKIEAIFTEWQEGLAAAFRRGQEGGNVRGDIDPDATAAFLIGALEGMAGLAKTVGSRELLLDMSAPALVFLESLRPKEVSKNAA